MRPFQEQVLCLWEWCDSYGVVSLFDVLQFYADIIAFQESALNACEAKLGFEKDETQVHPDAVRLVDAKLRILMALYGQYGMDSSAAQCGRILEKLDRQQGFSRCGNLREDLKQLRERTEDELKKHYFLHLDPKQSNQFQNPVKDWEQITSRFHKMKYNVEEMGRCFALERYGAAVFHVMQVAEYGVIQLGTLLQETGNKPGWGCLKRLQGLIAVEYPKRSPLAQQHSKLLEETVPLAVIMKDKWRHKLDHVDNQIVWVETDFSPLVAEEIITATRAFMRKLADMMPC